MSEKPFYEKGLAITQTFQAMNALFEQILTNLRDVVQMIETVHYNLNHELWQLIPKIPSKPIENPLGYMWQGR